MSSTVDRLVFAAQAMEFGVTAEVFMPIRITRPDKSLYGMQPYEIKRLVAAHSDESTALDRRNHREEVIFVGDEKVIKQDGKTYHQDWKGDWVAETDWLGNDKVETDWLGNPKIETDWLGNQKVETDWFGNPIIPPDKK